MTPAAIIADLRQAGIILFLAVNDTLKFRAQSGAMNDQAMAMIKEHKESIISWLKSDPCLRLLTNDEKSAISQTFADFRNQHGHALVSAGWNRESVFLGLHPPDATTVGEVHGLIYMLMDGGWVEQITQKALYLRNADGSREAWLRSGCFVGDPYLRELESTTLKSEVNHG